MRTCKTTLLLASLAILLLSACKKETSFTYKASCDDCLISYYDESGNFVSREAHQGSFEKEISVVEFSPVMIAVKSSKCPESTVTLPASTTCDSTLFVNDVIMIELWRSGEKIFADTSMGKPEQAISHSYIWQK
jgi:hypothetical protein